MSDDVRGWAELSQGEKDEAISHVKDMAHAMAASVSETLTVALVERGIPYRFVMTLAIRPVTIEANDDDTRSS